MKKINLGCGWRNFGKDWIHIDSGEFDHIDKRYKSIVDLDFKADKREMRADRNLITYKLDIIMQDIDEIKKTLKEKK